MTAMTPQEINRAAIAVEAAEDIWRESQRDDLSEDAAVLGYAEIVAKAMLDDRTDNDVQMAVAILDGVQIAMRDHPTLVVLEKVAEKIGMAIDLLGGKETQEPTDGTETNTPEAG